MADKRRRIGADGLCFLRSLPELQLNAEGAPDRILVLPLGEIVGRDGREWDLSREDAAALVALIVRDGLDIVLDRDHESIWGNTRAAGWLSNWAVEEIGVTAKLELTEEAKADVEGRYYRYLSPAFRADKRRILAMHSVALTNTPNLAELPALNNQERQEDEDMSEPDTNAREVEKLRAENSELRAELEKNKQALKDLQEASAKRDQEVLVREVGSLVENAVKDGRLVPAQVESAKALGLNDVAALRTLLDAQTGTDLAALTRPQTPPPGASPPEGNASLTPSQLAVCRSLGLTPERYAQQLAQATGA